MRRPRPTTQPPPVSPWLGLSSTLLGGGVLLAGRGAAGLAGLRLDDDPGSAGASALALGVGLVVVVVLLRVNALVVRRELRAWTRLPRVAPRPVPLLLACLASAVAFQGVAPITGAETAFRGVPVSAAVAAPLAGLLAVCLACAATPAGRRAWRVTVATYVAWSCVGAPFVLL